MSTRSLVCVPNLLVATVATMLPLVFGCSDLLKQPYPGKSYFGIDPGSPDTSSLRSPFDTKGSVNANLSVFSTTRPTAAGAMLVRLRVIPPYDGRAFIYRDGPAKYDSDYYANWIAQPSALLTGGLTDWLDRAGPLPVVTNGSTVRADLVLEGEVTRLLIDRLDRARPRAVLAVRFFLSRQTSAGTTVLSDTSYATEVPVSADNPAGYAASYGQAYRQVLQRLADDLRRGN